MLFSIGVVSYADEIEEEQIEIERIKEEALETLASSSEEPSINSRAAVVLERDSKEVLYSKNMNDKRAMASTTKVMTALIALEKGDLEQEIIVSKKAAAVGGSSLELKTGDKITMLDLLYGLMLVSGNDAAAQIAETIGGDYEGFAVLMNDKAKELGLNNTNFVTPHGLDKPDHYTTAYELAMLTDYALNNKKFSEIVRCKTKTILVNGQPRELYNTNELLGNLNGVDGVKTGFTNNAGRCLVTSCVRNNMNLISVVLGADTKKFRTKDSIKILEYVYKTYELVDLKNMIEEEFHEWYVVNKNQFIIEKGVKQTIALKIEDNKYTNYPVKVGGKQDITIEIEVQKKLKAPVESNRIIGKMKIVIDKDNIIELDILTNESVNKKGIIEYLLENLGKYKFKDLVENI
jgi:D-alanyl-D-alanine carboxypeptidase (penicillin-binding protein 5/6)